LLKKKERSKAPKKWVSTGSFFDFCKFMSFTTAKKSGLTDFPEERAPTKVNFTEGKARKFTVSFAFCTHVDVIKYQKTLTFSFECTQIT